MVVFVTWMLFFTYCWYSYYFVQCKPTGILLNRQTEKTENDSSVLQDECIRKMCVCTRVYVFELHICASYVHRVPGGLVLKKWTLCVLQRWTVTSYVKHDWNYMYKNTLLICIHNDSGGHRGSVFCLSRHLQEDTCITTGNFVKF